jgi:hypothetical protein
MAGNGLVSGRIVKGVVMVTKRLKVRERGRTALLVLIPVLLLTVRAMAQQTLPEVPSPQPWPLTALETEPALQIKVWLQSPESTMQRTLAQLTDRIGPHTSLKLEAQGNAKRIPVSCFVAGAPLRDVLDGLALLDTRQRQLGLLKWRRVGDGVLQLGLVEDDLQRQNSTNRRAYYGMSLVRAVQRTPADVRESLAHQHSLPLDTLPAPVQQAVQAVLKLHPGTDVGRLDLPANPQSTLLNFTADSNTGEQRYKVVIMVQQKTDANRVKNFQSNFEFHDEHFHGAYTGTLDVLPTHTPDPALPANLAVTLDFTPEQAIAYTPDPHYDGLAREPAPATRNDRSLTLLVTLNLHTASLPQALQALHEATRLPLLAEGTDRPAVQADFACAKLPASLALDKICTAYGYEWQQLASGIIVLRPLSK